MAVVAQQAHEEAAQAPPIDARELRNVLGAFVTGVTVITTLDRDGRQHGLTVNSFSSVSLDPPLVLWSQSLRAPSHLVFRDAERFAVNVLSEDQVAVSDRFARGGGDKFAGCGVRRGLGGVPLIEGCAAWIECRREQNLPGGDHMVFLGRVERIERSQTLPLVFGSGRYLVAQPHDLGWTDEAQPHVAPQRLLREANRAAMELSRELDETVGVAVWGNLGPTIVQWAPRGDPFTDNNRAGLVVPILGSASGLAFAAWLPRELTAPCIERERPPQQGPDELGALLAGIRAAGVSRVVGVRHEGDRAAVSAVSAPVFDSAGSMVLALTIAGAADRLDVAEGGRVATRLREAARALQCRERCTPAILLQPPSQRN